jgi:hypothetical protein
MAENLEQLLQELDAARVESKALADKLTRLSMSARALGAHPHVVLAVNFAEAAAYDVPTRVGVALLRLEQQRRNKEVSPLPSTMAGGRCPRCMCPPSIPGRHFAWCPDAGKPAVAVPEVPREQRTCESGWHTPAPDNPRRCVYCNAWPLVASAEASNG